MLRSRGMTRRAILGLHLLMWLMLAGFALGIALAAAPSVVRLVARTTSFLRFNHDVGSLGITFTEQSILAGAVTSLVAASSGLYMAWRTSRQTITRFKQTAARASKAWWQRMYLDLILLVPASYVLYTLWKKGGLVTSAEDPFSDPAIFLAPTLFSLGFTLLFLRLWPVLLRAGAWFLAYDRGIVLLMALRELTRSVGRYRGTLIMMCFTLSLIGFTASMASTIDRSLEDTVYYKNGADVVLIAAADVQTEENQQENTITVTGYTTLPASDLLTVSGVRQVSRVGRYQGRLALSNQRIDGTILGIDRAALAPVTFFRSDYADEPLADELNKLAGNRTGVLLSTETVVQYNLRIGQEIGMQVYALDTWYDMTVPIVGVLDYFPTLDPHTGFFLITNIDAIFEIVGTELPHNYWLSLEPGADRAEVRDSIRQKGFPVLEWRDSKVALEAAQTAPARRGVLGFLSVGFMASILLTLVGAIIQTAASFRAQTIQLGSLRAMGLGGKAVGIYLILSQGMVASSGILGGTLIGMGTTLLFLPLLDFSSGLPPYLVRVAWDEIVLVYGVFAGILFGITLLTALLLGRERLITVVKLGDV
jgi:putative ABC transport system permease protein